MIFFNFVALAAEVTEKCSDLNYKGDPTFGIRDKTIRACAANVEGIEAVVQNFLGIVTGLGALLALAMIFVGGFKYIIARGDPKATDSARATITWAVAGLIFIIAAYLIIRLVASFTGVGVDTFKIPTGSSN